MHGNEPTSTDSCDCAPGCCGGAPSASITEVAQDALRNQVRDGYARIAATGSWSALQSAGSTADACCAGGGCCGPATFTPEQLATAIGYTQAELAVAPDGANMGLCCGNPTALASLRAGETVLDLGAGGGFDCFIAGAKVGATGRVIGVDMTPAMLSKARANIAGYAEQTEIGRASCRERV